MPTKRRRTARVSRMPPGISDWLDTEDARVFFMTPELYEQWSRPPRPAVHLSGYRPWWTFPDWVLCWLRGKPRFPQPPEPEAVAFVQALEAAWQERHGPARNLMRGRKR